MASAKRSQRRSFLNRVTGAASWCAGNYDSSRAAWASFLTDSKAMSTSHSGTISLRSTWPPKGPDPFLEPEYRRTLLLTCDMGQGFGKSERPFLYNDVLVSLLINRLFAIFAKYDFRHLRTFYLFCSASPHPAP